MSKPVPLHHVTVAFPFGEAGPNDVIGMSWRDIDDGQKITPDGALARARRHVKEFAGAVCLVTKGDKRLWFVKRNELWDLSGPVPRWAL